MIPFIVTHPGSAHKDEFLACSVLISLYAAPIQRREPMSEDLENPSIFVVDVGDRHEPEKRNFDHHQFSREATPTCSLSLVLQDIGIYDDARAFCDWLEPAEWFDCRGANNTAKWLGVKRDVIGQLSSPIDLSLLRRFAVESSHEPGEPIWEIMKMIGDDLVNYLKSLRERLEFIETHSEVWNLEGENSSAQALFLPRTQPLPEDPSMGVARYIEEKGLSSATLAMVYPDRRGNGYGLSRYSDHPRMDFTRIKDEPDVHFAHAAGFVAKTSSTDTIRLKELLAKSCQ